MRESEGSRSGGAHGQSVLVWRTEVACGQVDALGGRESLVADGGSLLVVADGVVAVAD
jgi:hypothetical protein